MRRGLRFLVRYGYAAASSLYLFTGGVLSARHRGLINDISRHFGYPGMRTNLPRIALRDLDPHEPSMQLREPEAVDGNVTLYELLVLARAVAARRPAVLFEIGTFDGRTTLNLAANAPPEARVYTLDLPRAQMNATRLPLDSPERLFVDKAASGMRFRGADCEGRITQLYGDSAAFDFSPFEGRVEFVFVDGSHAYEYVLSDSRAALRLARGTGGIIFWHDYGVWDGVTRALEELYLQEPEFSGLRQVEGTSLVCLQPDRIAAAPEPESGGSTGRITVAAAGRQR